MSDASGSNQRPGNSRLLIAAGFIVIVTAASGVVHGRYTNRWGTPADLDAAEKRLLAMEESLGTWRMTAESEISSVAIETLENPTYVHRTYVNDESGDEITLAILVGRPGPISVHTPDICYSSRDTSMLAKDKVEVTTHGGRSQSTFWRSTFKSNNLSGRTFRVFYAWSSDCETWVAAENPRLTFGGAGVLYKIQLVADELPDDAEVDPAEQFLTALHF